ncbi:carbohydrate ABC transporter permease [Oceanobacillus salinisoli]|uniref:carbohydrate ABC transporter permease n=1 Tax=Oceanobacillus salinisoli TaxID=2678611 RepID=UPI0012E113AF|nr:sugar ABC transporter permease [Oceanobacillus salinisoli]
MEAGRYGLKTDKKLQTRRAESTLWKDIVRSRTLYLFISPFYLLFIVFGIFPILFSIFLSFHSWDGIGDMSFVGLNNFTSLFSDGVFWRSIINTFIIWIISVVPSIILGLIIANLINSPITRFKDFFKVTYFLPNVTAAVAVAIVFSSVFSTHFGLINFFLESIGLERIRWLTSSVGIKVVIALMVIWGSVGYNSILYLAGLQRIPKELYEAAQIDGANSLQIFTKVTLPLMKPIILFTVIMSTISGLQIFTEPQILAEGRPIQGSMTIVLYLYEQSFKFNQFGYGAAISWVLFIIILFFSILNWKFFQKPKNEGKKLNHGS